ncbi:hypothetical protein [Chryseobacterium sp. JK1]|uniref:hypothetical protein n=1 Tax=Chryseobacterium sp. JK1 TaxID=874294 RepID=UPI003D6828F6
MKIFVFLGIIFSSMVSAQKYNHTEEERVVVDNMVTSQKYGIKDINGNWVLKPSYYYIEDFYDDELNLKDTVAVFYNSTYYKNSNIFLGNKAGLISNRGKVLIPDRYDQLVCHKGNCAASIDKKTYIIDYQNNRKSKPFDGQAKYYRDSLLILEQKQNHYYVENLRSGKLEGPFYNAKILQGKDVYCTSSKDGVKFHKLNGELLLESDEIYFQYDDNFFADDVYIAHKDQRKFFKNLKGKKMALTYDDIEIKNGEVFEICTDRQNGGDYHYCRQKMKFSIFNILKGLGEIDNLDVNNSYDINFPDSRYDSENIPPINIVRKNNKYAFATSKGEIISEFYPVLKPSFAENEDTFYFEKNTEGKTISGIIENGDETLKTSAKVIDFYGNQMLIFEKEQNQYKIISKDREIILKENPGPLKFVGVPLESQLYTFESNNSFFTVNSKGKIRQTKFQGLSNFYKGYAFALEKSGEALIVNEKLKVVKILPNLKYIYNKLEIDPNGNIVLENKNNSDNQFIINYKGEIILDKNNAEIKRINNYLYRINNTRYYRGGYTFVDKDGKSFYDYGENLKNSRIFRKKNYFYIMVTLKDGPPYFYFFDNFGKFLGKDLPLYKQSIKDY